MLLLSLQRLPLAADRTLSTLKMENWSIPSLIGRSWVGRTDFEMATLSIRRLSFLPFLD